MNVIAVIIIVLGVAVIVGFLGYEVFGLVRDIRKAVAKKKAKKAEKESLPEKHTKDVEDKK